MAISCYSGEVEYASVHILDQLQIDIPCWVAYANSLKNKKTNLSNVAGYGFDKVAMWGTDYASGASVGDLPQDSELFLVGTCHPAK